MYNCLFLHSADICLVSDDISEQQSGSPSSGEVSDREDFRKKILEILSDPSDNPEQMKKLFKAVIEAKGE